MIRSKISNARSLRLRSAAIFVGLFLAILGPGHAKAGPLEPYAGCYTDIDGFVLAIGADLRAYRKAARLPDFPVYKEMATAAYLMHKKAVVPRGNGWVFQPGGYARYPDFAFAGWDGRGRPPESAIVEDIAWDVSHFMRWALWLTNFEQAEVLPQRRQFYRTLRRGLANQLVDVVLIPPSRSFRTYRLNNFMDGRNGWFRWDRKTGRGVAPYEMTGSFILGWWSFLDDPRVTQAYRQMAATFPLSEPEQKMLWINVSQKYNVLAPHFTRLAGLQRGDTVHAEDVENWKAFEAPYLQKPLWQDDYVQTAYHDLMLPMHIAFLHNMPRWQKDVAAQFSMFSAARVKFPPSLNELHYLHLATRFMALAARAGKANLIPAQLPAMAEGRLLQLWSGGENPVSLTGWGEPEFHGFSKYLAWKLQSPCPQPERTSGAG